MIQRVAAGLRALRSVGGGVFGFAKEAPAKKEGKKDEKAAEAVAVVEEVPLSTIAVKWISPTHASLSPSELRYSKPHSDTTAKALQTSPAPTRRSSTTSRTDCCRSLPPSSTTQSSRRACWALPSSSTPPSTSCPSRRSPKACGPSARNCDANYTSDDYRYCRLRGILNLLRGWGINLVGGYG